MPSIKGILKYGLYFFIALWMFVLGIMVGRGNSPVSFDTSGFQARLENIAAEFGKNDKEKQIELKFYDVLDKPVTAQKPSVKKETAEIVPVNEVPDEQKTPDIKLSTKRKTFKARPPEKTAPKNVEPPKQQKVQKKANQIKPAPKPSKSGVYTVQIAAYKDFKDAVTQMAALEKKGVESYRVKALKDGQTWYRVRSGSFASLEEAKKYQVKLNQKKIKAMIIKRDTNENNQG